MSVNERRRASVYNEQAETGLLSVSVKGRSRMAASKSILTDGQEHTNSLHHLNLQSKYIIPLTIGFPENIIFSL